MRVAAPDLRRSEVLVLRRHSRMQRCSCLSRSSPPPRGSNTAPEVSLHSSVAGNGPDEFGLSLVLPQFKSTIEILIVNPKVQI
jgi:hypothetical protein